jgi:hypothetical protein
MTRRPLRYDPARRVDVLAIRRDAVLQWIRAHHRAPRRRWVSLQDTWVKALRRARKVQHAAQTRGSILGNVRKDE